MLDTTPHTQGGHILLEAIIGCALALSTSVGVWKLASVARHLAQRAIIRTDAQCDTPTCALSSPGIVCECGGDSFVIAR